MTEDELQACFQLIEKTSSADYHESSMGWHPGKKRAEMKSSELRYILVVDGEGKLQGFVSLMPTWEEGEPVVYCYEIHLEDELQGSVFCLSVIAVPLLLVSSSPSYGVNM